MKNTLVELLVAFVKVVLGVAAGLVGIFGFASVMIGQQSKPVTYRVAGSARSALVTYSNDQGGTEQQTVPLPWSWPMHVKKGAILQVTAQSQDSAGDVTVDIDADGQNRKEARSSGAYAVASASDLM